MVHLVTLGAGGGSIASFDRMYNAVAVGPKSAGSDPGPACYDRGGMSPTVTDADLVLGYLDADNYAGGSIPLNPKRSMFAIEETLCDDLDVEPIAAALLVKEKVDSNMANGVNTELRVRGYDPKDFTMLAYGGNGPLHCCGIASKLKINKILATPFSSVFSAVGAGNMHQMHIHETSLFMVLYDSTSRKVFDNYSKFNDLVVELSKRGQADLVRQGSPLSDIKHSLELDMRYGNQLVQTTVVVPKHSLEAVMDVMNILDQFSSDYGKRFGEGSQAPEAGIRINTIRVASYVEHDTVKFDHIKPIAQNKRVKPPAPSTTRKCYFVGDGKAVETPVWNKADIPPGTEIDGPGLVSSEVSTYLIEPGWKYVSAEQGAVWFLREEEKN
jgi:N-methylhydantoinase A